MIDMREKKEQREIVIETLEALDKAKREGCYEALMLQMLAKAIPGLHNEHAFTAIEMYKALVEDDVGSVVFSAKTQSGKTGAIIAFCVLLYQQATHGSYKDKYKLWFSGPSDLALKDQTETRLFANAMIEVNTLGSKCWHAAEYYRNNGVEKKKLVSLGTLLTRIILSLYLLMKLILVLAQSNSRPRYKSYQNYLMGLQVFRVSKHTLA